MFIVSPNPPQIGIGYQKLNLVGPNIVLTLSGLQWVVQKVRFWFEFTASLLGLVRLCLSCQSKAADQASSLAELWAWCSKRHSWCEHSVKNRELLLGCADFFIDTESDLPYTNVFWLWCKILLLAIMLKLMLLMLTSTKKTGTQTLTTEVIL